MKLKCIFVKEPLEYDLHNIDYEIYISLWDSVFEETTGILYDTISFPIADYIDIFVEEGIDNENKILTNSTN
jgi:hypothetical protein